MHVHPGARHLTDRRAQGDRTLTTLSRPSNIGPPAYISTSCTSYLQLSFRTRCAQFSKMTATNIARHVLLSERARTGIAALTVCTVATSLSTFIVLCISMAAVATGAGRAAFGVSIAALDLTVSLLVTIMVGVV